LFIRFKKENSNKSNKNQRERAGSTTAKLQTLPARHLS